MLRWHIALTIFLVLPAVCQTAAADSIETELRSARHLEISGRLAEAEAVLRRALDRTLRSDPGSVQAALVMNQLGLIRQVRDQQQDADNWYRKAVAVLEKAGSQELAAAVKVNLACSLIEQRRLAEAERLDLRRQLSVLKDKNSVLQAMTAMAATLHAGGKRDEAEQLYLETVRILQLRPLGASGADLATNLNNLGTIEMERERHAEAIRYFQESVDIWRKVVGETHPSLLKTSYNLVHSRLRTGQYAEAVSGLREILRFSDTALGSDNSLVGALYLDLAEALKKTGNAAEAKEMKRAAAAAQKRSGPARETHTVDLSELMTLRARPTGRQ